MGVDLGLAHCVNLLYLTKPVHQTIVDDSRLLILMEIAIAFFIQLRNDSSGKPP